MPKISQIQEKKVLFIGNSHAVGYFNMFNMNQPLFKNYEFSMLRLGLQELKI